MVTPDDKRAAALRSAVVLAFATIAAAIVVLAVDHEARPIIEAKQRASQARELDALLGGAAHDNDVLADVTYVRDPELLGTTQPVPVHRVRLSGHPVALILEPVAPDGYAGAITLRIAVGVDGRILGARALQHHETPGLGDRIDLARSNWMHGFEGRWLGAPPAERWQVRKDGGDFDQFTGATVTPRAVVHAISACLLYVQQHHDELFAAPVTMPP